MKALRDVIAVTLGVTVALALATWARPAFADTDPTASPRVVHVTARASHTDATARAAARTGRAMHAHHHRHGGPRAGRLAGATTPRPQPLSPPRHHSEHRAALPRVSSGSRTHAGPRDGARALASLPGLPPVLTLAESALAPDQNASFTRCEGHVHAGRGPPRAGRSSSLPPSRAGGLPSFLPSTALSLPHPSGSTDAPRSHGGFRAVPGALPAACSYRVTPSEEPLQSCSHTGRPEGAAVCCHMPSVGGFS